MTKKQLIIGISALVTIAVIASGTVWLYQGDINSTKKSVFKTLPLPAALIGFGTISADTVLSRLDTADKVLTNAGQEITPEIKQTVFDQVIDAKLIEKVSSDNGIVVTDAQINQEYEDILKQYGNNDQNAFVEELQSAYGVNIDQFKNEIVREEVVKTELSKWFNKQESLNQSAYEKVKQLQGMLSSGKSFEEVASEYTQDEATKSFAGDSGFVTIDDLLPEFQEVAKTAELNKPTVVSSRYGIHIIVLSDKNVDPETNEERYNLKQIFVKPADFQEWYKSQTEKIKVTRLLNLN